MKRMVVALVCALGLSAGMQDSLAGTGIQEGERFLVAQQAAVGGPAEPSGAGQAQESDNKPGYTSLAAIFKGRCVMCHSGSKPPVELRVDSYANIRKGSARGPVVIPGEPDKSEMIKRVRGISLPRMPLNGPPWLSDAEIGSIESWIAAGAPEGKTTSAAEPQTASNTPPAAPQQPEAKGKLVTYTQVAPIFNGHCTKCHTKKGVMGPPPEGLRLDSYDAIFTNAERQMVIPESPGASLLVRAIRGQSTPRMPFDGPPYLSDEQIELIVTWVSQGAPDADGNKRPMPVGAEVRLQGHLTAQWVLDGLPLIVDGQTRLDKKPSVGSYVEVRGLIQQDGGIRATRIRRRQ